MKPRPVFWTCPECAEKIAVASHVSTKVSHARATVALEIVPDIADAWAHVWSHAETGTGTS